ncbi:MAG TPA: alpha/beta fold hydrolase [Allosphingosinicella sp.]|nr:alpha/beta fold hydrolase [Allosphingosinicella sp.]
MRHLAIGIGLTLVALPGCATPTAQSELAVLPEALRNGVHEVQLNGARHWYKVAGEAPASVPPVVFLHGGPGGNTYAFEQTAGGLLERSLRMVYFEQRGSGRSERPSSGDYATATLVEDLEALRRHLGVPKISIITHSFGTVIGLSYAAKYPEHVSRMVIAGGLADAPRSCRELSERMATVRPEIYRKAFPNGTAAVSDAEICSHMFRAAPGRAGEELRNADMFPNPEVLKRFKELEAASGLRNTGELGGYQFQHGLLQWRFTDQARVTMPVLVVAGEHDWAAGPETQRYLARSLPNGRIVEYEGAGHWMFIDQPERFARDVSAFLRRASTSRQPPPAP